MRQALFHDIRLRQVHIRRNSKTTKIYGGFKFIVRFKKYTRSYSSASTAALTPISQLLSSSLAHYSWWLGSSYARPSRVRRFFVARLKRISSDTSVINSAWVTRGSRIFIFKKGQNSRMGKGSGSYHSSRRQFVGGLLLARVSASTSHIINNITNYAKARWGRSLTISADLSDCLSRTACVGSLANPLGSFEPQLRQRFARRRSVWSILRRRSLRRVASALYGIRPHLSNQSFRFWRWSGAAFTSRRSSRPLSRADRVRARYSLLVP